MKHNFDSLSIFLLNFLPNWQMICNRVEVLSPDQTEVVVLDKPVVFVVDIPIRIVILRR